MGETSALLGLVGLVSGCLVQASLVEIAQSLWL